MSSFVQDHQQPQQQQEQVIGVVTGISQKPGTNRYKIGITTDAGGNRGLWTEDQQMVAYCQSQYGNRLAFLCRVSEYTYNNQLTRSLWIEQVGPPSVGAPVMAGPQMPSQPPVQQPWAAQAPQQPVVVQPQVTPMQGPVGDPKQPFIHRQTATKVAVQLLAYLKPEEQTMTNLLVLSERLVAYYDRGLSQVETVEDLIHRAMPQGMEAGAEYDAAQGIGYGNTPPDDIPF